MEGRCQCTYIFWFTIGGKDMTIPSKSIEYLQNQFGAWNFCVILAVNVVRQWARDFDISNYKILLQTEIMVNAAQIVLEIDVTIQ
jgi:hypothetical protein